MTRRYRSLRSEVAKRPPSSGTSGRRSGGITGMTSSIIHSGLLPDFAEGLDDLQALGDLLALRPSEVLGASSPRAAAGQLVAGRCGASSSRIASAPMPATKLVAELLADSRYCSSVRSSFSSRPRVAWDR